MNEEEKEVIVCGEEYRIDDYDIRFVYTENNVEATHFILEKRKRSDTM